MSRCRVGKRFSQKFGGDATFLVFRRVRNTYRGFMYATGRIEDVPVSAVDFYCAHCFRMQKDHVNNQCLFSARKFRPFEVKAEQHAYHHLDSKATLRLQFLINKGGVG